MAWTCWSATFPQPIIAIRSIVPEVRLFWNERCRSIDHASKHCANFTGLLRERGMIAFGYIAAIMSEIEAGFRFSILSVRIRLFAYKVRLVRPLGPHLSQICTNRASGTPDL